MISQHTSGDWRVSVATMGPLGRMRRAPGTWGSIPGIALGALLQAGTFALWADKPWLAYSVAYALVLLACLPAVAVIRAAEQAMGAHDPKSIVIDEVLGQAIVTIALPTTALWLGIGFGLFRLFDIAKPWPVSYVDQHVTGPWGTLGDDLLAGVLAALLGLVLTFLFI